MKNNKEITKESYNKIANDWTERHFLPSCPNNMVDEVDKFVKYLKYKKDVLDAGCGPGKNAKELVKYGLHVTGIDFSREMIKEAKYNIPKGNFKLMDIEHLKFKDGTFDGLFCFATLLHIERKNVIKVLKEFKRVLKNDGILALSVKTGRGERFESEYNTKRFFVYYNKSEITNKVKTAGFKVLNAYIKKLTCDWIIIFAKAVK